MKRKIKKVKTGGKVNEKIKIINNVSSSST